MLIVGNYDEYNALELASGISKALGLKKEN